MDTQGTQHRLHPDVAYMFGSLRGAGDLLARASEAVTEASSSMAAAAGVAAQGEGTVTRRELADAVAGAWADFSQMLERLRDEAGQGADTLRGELSQEDRVALDALEARVTSD